ncbi:MAG: enoyl-CoA hydratase, partial [Alphaproteobacteria bacterium]|nr:enoyl-CoA hydratase [Alphaproteobacteria bacterium]
REDSTFSIPAARLGLAYPPNATTRLREIVGAAQAKYILFTAARFDCAKATNMGLLTATASLAAFEESLASLTAQICANAPLTLRAAKYIVDKNDPAPADIKKRVAFCLNSDDYKEGRTAFKEKRAPLFRGE